MKELTLRMSMRLFELAIVVAFHAVACSSAPPSGPDLTDESEDERGGSRDATADHGRDWVDLTTTDSAVDMTSCEPSCLPGECGEDGCGGYCPPCATPVSGTSEDPFFAVNYTFCDESTRSCRAPSPNCEDGWCRIPPGSFIMGVNRGCPWGPTDAPYMGVTRPVKLTRAFRIMRTEVTVKQWMTVMGDILPNTSLHKECGLDCPIANVTYWDILVFANRLSTWDGLEECYLLEGCSHDEVGHFICEIAYAPTGPDCTGYRLPSDAEWELSAGASSDQCMLTGPAYWEEPYGDSEICCSELHFAYAWCRFHCEAHYDGCVPVLFGEKCCGLHPVAMLDPNAFGLYDVIGNAEEFIFTWRPWANGQIPRPQAVPLDIDPGYDLFAADHAIGKGGSFHMPAPNNSPSRGVGRPVHDGNLLTLSVAPIGFRLVKTELP